MAHGTGVSQGRFPDGSANIVSFPTTVSPGESNYLPLTNAVANEILTHTDPPLEDAIEYVLYRQRNPLVVWSKELGMLVPGNEEAQGANAPRSEGAGGGELFS